MSRTDRFSRRNGFRTELNAPITMRNEVPDDLRGYLVELAYENGFKADDLRSIVCRLLRKAPDVKHNWGADNIDREIRTHLEDCPWYFLYDLIETLAEILSEDGYREYGKPFEEDINEFFMMRGIGWKLENNRIVFRGDEGLDAILAVAAQTINQNGYQTASSELHEAIVDMSRRPTADVTGAIQHAMASLECVARDLTNSKETLGKWIERNREAFPPPLDKATELLWGYASNHGRHLKEGDEASFEEAELILGLCASLGNYLAHKGKSQAQKEEPQWGFPRNPPF